MKYFKKKNVSLYLLSSRLSWRDFDYAYVTLFVESQKSSITEISQHYKIFLRQLYSILLFLTKKSRRFCKTSRLVENGLFWSHYILWF